MMVCNDLEFIELLFHFFSNSFFNADGIDAGLELRDTFWIRAQKQLCNDLRAQNSQNYVLCCARSYL